MIALIVLVAIPLIEIAVLIKIGQLIGFWPALGIVIGTFILGAAVVGRSGFASAIKVRDALSRGEPPVAAMIDSALLVVGGVLLMTPGFIADFVGLALLIPPIRKALARAALRNAIVIRSARVDSGHHNHSAPGGHPRDDMQASGSGPIIEGEFERLDERPIDPRTRAPGGSNRTS